MTVTQQQRLHGIVDTQVTLDRPAQHRAFMPCPSSSRRSHPGPAWPHCAPAPHTHHVQRLSLAPR